MSIWRAPLLLLGILVILLTGAALFAPYLVDWNRYKPQMERVGGQLLGRAVEIGGDVSIVLFPRPAIRLSSVRVANAREGRFPYFLEVPRLTARISLGGILGGRLEVEQVRLERPVLYLEHFGEGHGNWHLRPKKAMLPRLPFSPRRIAIAGIDIEDGRVLLADARLKRSLEISRIHARLQAPRLAGPWRMRGKAHLVGKQRRFVISTGEFNERRPLPLSLVIDPPADRGGHQLRLDGALRLPALLEEPARALPPGDSLFEGRMQIHSVLGKGRTDPLKLTGRLDLAAKLRVQRDTAELLDIRVTPQHPRAPFDTISGRARLQLGAVVEASIALKTARLDIGHEMLALMGGDVRPRQEKVSPLALLEIIARRARALPPDIVIDLDADIAALRVGGGELTGFKLRSELSSELLSLHRLRAELPGHGHVIFSGELLPAKHFQLAGRVELAADDARGLLYRLVPAARAALGDVWEGAPGRLTLRGQLDLTRDMLRLADAEARLDASSARLSLRLPLTPPSGGASASEQTETPAIDIRLEAENLDLDRHLRRGLPPARILRRLLSASRAPLQLRLGAARLSLGGMRARELRARLILSGDTFSVPLLQVTDLHGLRLKGAGGFERARKGLWKGRMELNVKGERAADIWAVLSGLGLARETDERSPPWLDRLGRVDMQMLLALTPRQEASSADQRLELVLSGRAGPARMLLTLSGEGVQHGIGAANWRLRGSVESLHTLPLLAIFHLFPELRRDGPLNASFSAQGRLDDGARGRLSLRLADLLLNYEGSLRLAGRASDIADPLALAGEGSLRLRAADIRPWLYLARLRLPDSLAVEGRMEVAFSPRRLVLRRMQLRTPRNTLSGELGLSWPDPLSREPTTPSAEGRVIMRRLDTRALMHLLFTDPAAPPRLHAAPAAGWALEVELRADSLRLPASLGEVARPSLLLRGDGGVMKMHLRARGMRLDATFKREKLLLRAQGRLRATPSPRDILRTADGAITSSGSAIVDMEFSVAASSLATLPSALAGEGELRLRGIRVKGLAPAAFLRAALALRKPEELEHDSVLRSRLRRGTLVVPDMSLSLRLKDGMLAASPADYTWKGMQVRLAPLFELPNKLDVEWRLRPATQPEAPAISVSLVGRPGALELVEDVDAFMNWLSVHLMQRSLKELERIERERQRLIEEQRRLEEEQRKIEERRRIEEQRRQRLLEEQARHDEGAQGQDAGNERVMIERLREEARAGAAMEENRKANGEGNGKARERPRAPPGATDDENAGRQALEALRRQLGAARDARRPATSGATREERREARPLPLRTDLPPLIDWDALAPPSP